MAHVAIFAPREKDVEELHSEIVKALASSESFPYAITKNFLVSDVNGPLKGLQTEVGTIILRKK